MYCVLVGYDILDFPGRVSIFPRKILRSIKKMAGHVLLLTVVMLVVPIQSIPSPKENLQLSKFVDGIAKLVDIAEDQAESAESNHGAIKKEGVRTTHRSKVHTPTPRS